MLSTVNLMGQVLAGAAGASGILFGLATTFSKGNQTAFNVQSNAVVETLSNVIFSSMEKINQGVEITQNVVVGKNINIQCTGNVEIINKAVADMESVGEFTSESVADIQNTVMNMIKRDLVNDANIRTGFLSSLPPNITNISVEDNFRSIVQNVYSVTNMNLIKQSVVVNQNVVIGDGTRISGAMCRIGNTISTQLMAQASLNALSKAAFSNSVTNSIMTSISNKYKAVAEGPLDIFRGLIDAIGLLLGGIVIIVVIAVIVGIIIKLFKGGGETQKTDVTDLLLLNAATKTK